ncbi:MAG TPA: Ig-like domain-containing protein, partial [Polyangiales bacterium]|nr:Ig-like domain-containing protein [Polyangiales bacterium]
FAAPNSGAFATLTNPTPTTDSNGHVKVTATANATAGAYNVTASVSGVLNSAAFSLANLGSPASIVVASGNNQTIGVSSAAQNPLVVEVRDAANQLLPGVTVMFSAPNSGASGSFNTAVVVTDSSGRASADFTAGNVTGNYNVTASVSGVGTNALFMLSNSPSSATLIAVRAGNAQSTVVDTAFATALDVLVTDTFGNPVPNAAVSFSVPGAGASAVLSAYGASTDANGHVVVTASANTLAGTYDVVATTPGSTTPASFSLTNSAGAAANISVDASDARQSAKVGTKFAAPLGVVVSDAFGNPVAGANVSFVGPGAEPRAALSGGSAKTDNGGHASVTATAGSATGSYILTAKLDGGAGQADFVLTNTSGSTPVISVVAGSGQSSKVGTAFSTALEVLVTLDGTAVAQTPVTFAAPSGGASATFTSPSAVTDDNGHANVIAIAGTSIGSYTLTANVLNGSKPASFTLTNNAGSATSIVVASSSSPQSAQTNTRFGSRLNVSVFDAKGNPIAGQTVTFAAPSSGASAALDSVTATTDASGQANVGATANGTTGNYLVTAAVSGVTPATFQLQNTSAAPITIAIVSGSPQHATVNRAFGHTLAVKVSGANNTAIPNATVLFVAPSGGATATLSASSAMTNSSGIAEISATASQVSGDYEVVANVDGAAESARFSLTNDAGAPAMLVASRSSTPQSARVNTPYTNPLSVHVLDTFGNPVPGASVTFSAPANDPSATLTSSAATSGSNGEANVAAIALTKAGAFTVTATVNGTSVMASLQLTNTAGDPVNLSVSDGADQTTLASQPFGAPLKLKVV